MTATPLDTTVLPKPIGALFFDQVWGESWTYIKTVVDVMREPVIILNKDLRVMAANEPFYKTFKVDAKDTENAIVYDLGNGQWNIPTLKKLLDEILLKDTYFKGFEVSHEFPNIGQKIIMLNARQIHFTADAGAGLVPPIILLAMEDVTEMMIVAERLAKHDNQLVSLVGKLTDRTRTLEHHIDTILREVEDLKRK